MQYKEERILQSSELFTYRERNKIRLISKLKNFFESFQFPEKNFALFERGLSFLTKNFRNFQILAFYYYIERFLKKMKKIFQLKISSRQRGFDDFEKCKREIPFIIFLGIFPLFGKEIFLGAVIEKIG